MPIRIDSPAAATLLGSLNRTQSALNKSIERLSTGQRVNSAADDAAAISIINRLSAEIGGLQQASRNIGSAVSVAQTADGALQESTDILQRARSLAVQAANGSLSDSQRSNLQNEVVQLQSEFSRIANNTSLAGKKLLDGSFVNQTFQIGDNTNQTISLSIGSAAADAVGSFSAQSNASLGSLGAVSALGANFVQNNFAAQTLTINGDDVASTGLLSAGSSAKDIAEAINQNSSTTGVSATATTTATLSSLSVDGTVTFNLQGNTAGGSVAISAAVTTTDLSNLAESINDQSATTGITASSNGGTLTLTSNQGFDIAIEDFVNSAGGSTDTIAFGTAAGTVNLTDNGTTDSATVGGVVQLGSTGEYNIATDTGTTFLSASPSTASLSAFSSIDISTQTGASSALSVIDFSLEKIDELRTTLGAFENRITSALQANNSRGINATAARSQLLDADFAVELASLTKAQIIQSSALSVFAQTNANQRNILSLLSFNQSNS